MGRAEANPTLISSKRNHCTFLSNYTVTCSSVSLCMCNSVKMINIHCMQTLTVATSPKQEPVPEHKQPVSYSTEQSERDLPRKVGGQTTLLYREATMIRFSIIVNDLAILSVCILPALCACLYCTECYEPLITTC